MAFGWTHLMENRTVPRLCNSWKIELLLPLYHYLMSLGSVLWFFGHEYCMTCSSSRHYREQQPFKLWRHCLQHGTSQIHDPRIFTLFSYTNQSIHANFPSFFFFSLFFFPFCPTFLSLISDLNRRHCSEVASYSRLYPGGVVYF